MRQQTRLKGFLSLLAIGIAWIPLSAQAGQSAKKRYLVTALPKTQAATFQTMPPQLQNQALNLVDQNATLDNAGQSQADSQKAVELINEAEIPQLSITELRLSTLTQKSSGKSIEATLKIRDGQVIEVMDYSGWRKAIDLGNNTVASAKTGDQYTYTRGKLRKRFKRRYKSKRWSFRACRKNKRCYRKYKKITKRLKRNRYIPTRLRAKRCMKKRKCRNAIKRIISRYRTKARYIPTRKHGKR